LNSTARSPASGNNSRFVEEPQQFQFPLRREMTRPEAAWSPGIAFGGLVALPLVPASGLALTEGTSGADLESSFVLKMPAAPFVRSAEFDPPWGGLVRLALRSSPGAAGRSRWPKPALRPVVSYRWGPVNPELFLKLDADWDLSTRNLSQLTLGATVSRQALSLAPPDSELMTPVIQASFVGVRLVLKKSPRSTGPAASSKMLPVSLEECTAKPRHQHAEIEARTHCTQAGAPAPEVYAPDAGGLAAEQVELGVGLR
jgi:hypothetical protein